MLDEAKLKQAEQWMDTVGDDPLPEEVACHLIVQCRELSTQLQHCREERQKLTTVQVGAVNELIEPMQRTAQARVSVLERDLTATQERLREKEQEVFSKDELLAQCAVSIKGYKACQERVKSLEQAQYAVVSGSPNVDAPVTWEEQCEIYKRDNTAIRERLAEVEKERDGLEQGCLANHIDMEEANKRIEAMQQELDYADLTIRHLNERYQDLLKKEKEILTENNNLTQREGRLREALEKLNTAIDDRVWKMIETESYYNGEASEQLAKAQAEAQQALTQEAP